jgi:hypothetical protein
MKTFSVCMFRAPQAISRFVSKHVSRSCGRSKFFHGEVLVLALAVLIGCVELILSTSICVLTRHLCTHVTR